MEKTMDIISSDEEVYDYDFWFNQIELHGDVHNYGPDYVHNKILQQIIFLLDLPTGKIVMLGSNKCYGLELLCKQYGYDKVIGYDLHNPTNHKCVIQGNILTLAQPIESSLVINDIGNFELTPKAKIYAQEWAANNTVINGYVLGNTNNNKAGYNIEEYMSNKGFELIKLTDFETHEIPEWALQSYALYRRVVL